MSKKSAQAIEKKTFNFLANSKKLSKKSAQAIEKKTFKF